MKKLVAVLVLLVLVTVAAQARSRMIVGTPEELTDMCISIAALMKSVAEARDAHVPIEKEVDIIRTAYASLPTVEPYIERMARAVYVVDVAPLAVSGKALDTCMTELVVP